MCYTYIYIHTGSIHNITFKHTKHSNTENTNKNRQKHTQTGNTYLKQMKTDKNKHDVKTSIKTYTNYTIYSLIL